MTLAQLQSFVLVARLGLGQGRCGRARGHRAGGLGRGGRAAPGARRRAVRPRRAGDRADRRGRRLAALAGEILGLAEQARRSVPESPAGAPAAQWRPPTWSAEHIGPLIDAFTRPRRGARDRGRALRRCVVRRSARASPGRHRPRPPPGPERAATIATVALPALPPDRRRRARPSAGRRDAGSRRPRSPGERWLVGPPDLDPADRDGLVLEPTGLAPATRRAYTSHAAAIAAAAAGEGLLLTLAHSVLDEVRRRALVALDVRGTPLVELWHASTLGLGRALPAALALQRFATTPEATQAMFERPAGRVSTARARPAVHVTLWRSDRRRPRLIEKTNYTFAFSTSITARPATRTVDELLVARSEDPLEQVNRPRVATDQDPRPPPLHPTKDDLRRALGRQAGDLLEPARQLGRVPAGHPGRAGDRGFDPARVNAVTPIGWPAASISCRSASVKPRTANLVAL